MNYCTEYNEEMPVNGSNNAWEYYFRQPVVSLEKAYNSKNYILSDYAIHSNELPYSENSIDSFVIDDNKLREVSAVAFRQIKLNSVIQEQLDANWKKISDLYNGKILGVHVRGTDKLVPPPGHYMAPGLVPYVEVVDQYMKKHPDAGILLCADEKGSVEVFKERYPGHVYVNDVYRAEPGSTTGIHLEHKNVRPFHKYLLGVEVIMDTYMLAKCNALVHTHSNVTNAAIIINGGAYEERFFVG